MDNNELIRLNRALTEFYFSNVHNRLSEINTLLNLYKIRNISLVLILITFLPCFIFPPLLFLIMLFEPLFFAGLFVSTLLIASKTNSFSTRDVNQSEKISNTSIDAHLKQELMPAFISIFGNLSWTIGGNDKDIKDLAYLKNLNIFKASFSKLDDCIKGEYLGVSLKMLEVDSGLLNTENFTKFIFPVIFISGCLPFVVFFLFYLILFFWDTIEKFQIPNLGPGFLGVIILFVIPVVLPILFVAKRVLKPAFKGIIVELDMNKNFDGHTFILEKGAKGLKVDDSKFESVQLEDVEFAKVYNVYSDSQIESRYLLTTAFIDRLRNLKETFNAEYVRVAFKDNKVVLAIHTNRDMFSMAQYLTKTGQETFIKLFKEIVSVLDVVEALKLNQKLGL